jgi:signal peptidase I
MLRRLVLAAALPVISTLLVPVLVLVAAVLVATKVGLAATYEIRSSSMEPTLRCARPGPGCTGWVADRILVLDHWPGGYGRGAIVALRAPARARTACGADGVLAKRIVGLPGERMEVRVVGGQGFVFVDGRRLVEPYVAASSRKPAVRMPPVRVPRGRYFVLGDDRARSCDSRQWGTVASSDILGKAVLTYWPPLRVHLP